MNEKQKNILNLVLCFFLGVAVTLAVAIPISVSGSRRTDIKLGELSARLQESDRRYTTLKSTIESCREPVERIADFSKTGDGTLTGVIQNFKQIRDNVQILEERFYSIDNSSGNNNSINNQSDCTVEEIGGEQ